MGNQYTKYGRDRRGPPAARSSAEARSAGFTDGPYYHASDHADAIQREGFRTKGAEPWEIQDPGTMEEFKKFDTAQPTFLGTHPDQVKNYGNQIVKVHARPGTVRSAEGMTLNGGHYVTSPEHIMPVGLFNDRR